MQSKQWLPATFFAIGSRLVPLHFKFAPQSNPGFCAVQILLNSLSIRCLATTSASHTKGQPKEVRIALNLFLPHRLILISLSAELLTLSSRGVVIVSCASPHAKNIRLLSAPINSKRHRQAPPAAVPRVAERASSRWQVISPRLTRVNRKKCDDYKSRPIPRRPGAPRLYFD